MGLTEVLDCHHPKPYFGDITMLSNFDFNGQAVRFVDGKPVANDVAKILGYANPAKTISTKVKAKNKGVTEMVTPGGKQTVTVLEEAGIYQLIFGSKLEAAEKFQDWVFDEVLPQIRETGEYRTGVKPKTTAELMLMYAEQMVEMEHRQAKIELEQQLANQRLDELEDLTTQHNSEIDRIFHPNGHYFTVMGYFARHNLGSISSAKASAIGRKATKMCREQGIAIQPLEDARYGRVNSYPEDILDQVI